MKITPQSNSFAGQNITSGSLASITSITGSGSEGGVRADFAGVIYRPGYSDVVYPIRATAFYSRNSEDGLNQEGSTVQDEQNAAPGGAGVEISLGENELSIGLFNSEDMDVSGGYVFSGQLVVTQHE